MDKFTVNLGKVVGIMKLLVTLVISSLVFLFVMDLILPYNLLGLENAIMGIVSSLLKILVTGAGGVMTLIALTLLYMVIRKT